MSALVALMNGAVATIWWVLFAHDGGGVDLFCAVCFTVAAFLWLASAANE